MPKQDGSPTAAEKSAGEKAVPQHPALNGDESVEIAERSQDEDRLTATVHRKKFVVLARDWHGTDEAHRANIEATRQAMIGQGLRPTADGKYVGSEDHPDGASLVLTYEVPAKAAIVTTDEDPHAKHAHVTLDDQHAAEAGDPDPGTPEGS